MLTSGSKVSFYSIGENCLGHGILKRHGVKLHATPFSHSRSNIDYATQLVDSNFSEMLSENMLRYDERYNLRLVINPHYSCDEALYEHTVCNSFEFSHHDVIAKPEDRASLERKAQRLLGALHEEGPACFVYHYRMHKDQDIPRVAAKLRKFQDMCRARSGRPISVTLFTQLIVDHDDQRAVTFHKHDGVPIALLHTRRVWGGKDKNQFWGELDDDLFAKMIGAFEFHASTVDVPSTPEQKNTRSIVSRLLGSNAKRRRHANIVAQL